MDPDFAFDVLHNSGEKWIPVAANSIQMNKEILLQTASLLNQQQQQTIVDFDQHIEDVTKDWKNSHIR